MSLTLEEPELEALYQATCALERLLLPPTPDAHEFFAYDPLPWAIFLHLIDQAEQLVNGRRFLDVGCGLGTKLAYMNYLGWETTGIECHEPYAEIARCLAPNSTVTVADVFAVEFFDADLVYSYRLGVSEEMQCRVEQHIAAQMPKGSVLLLPTRTNPVRVI